MQLLNSTAFKADELTASYAAAASACWILSFYGASCRLLASRVFLSCGSQVEKQGKASGKVRERALTRAAVDEE